MLFSSQYQLHPDEEVRQALGKLCDRLCGWERATGRESVLILREKGSPENFEFRASSGKPLDGSQDDITDRQLMETADLQDERMHFECKCHVCLKEKIDQSGA